MIKFKDLLSVQKQTPKAVVFRCVYESPEKEDGFPNIKLKLRDVLVDEEKYKPFSVDITREIFEKMIEVANTKMSGKDFDIPLLLLQLANTIAVKTRRGAGNFIVMPDEIYIDIVSFGKMNLLGSIIKTIYHTPFLKNKIIVGYNGTGDTDTGLILHMQKGKYQIIEIEGAGNFYAVLEV